jgi:esterase/lipase superfamily enzyme
MDIVLVIGDEDPFLSNNRELSGILAHKGVGHVLTTWGGRAHQGSAWRAMVPLYL